LKNQNFFAELNISVFHVGKSEAKILSLIEILKAKIEE
jgi:hypothetical protein